MLAKGFEVTMVNEITGLVQEEVETLQAEAI
jgi:hypothetical protein